jgi:putative DNA primase/helicase
MGQCLLGKNITARLLVTHGQGGNGKSQVARIFRAIVGSENCYELRTKHVDSRFEQYRFIGKTLLLGADVPADFLSTAGAAELKKLSGGDALSPEAKSGNGIFELTGDLNFLITSNSRLKIHLEGDESAWRRRLLLIPWIAPKPKKEISGFADHLLETEGSGILNWALEGLETLLADVAIRASSLDWVIVRPGMLTDDPAKGGVRAVVDLAGINGGKIARADVARFVVDQLTTDTWLRRTPVLLW